MKINLELTIEEINQILSLIDQYPYRQVSSLIETIKNQSIAFMEKNKPVDMP
jgi:hypothetical protein